MVTLQLQYWSIHIYIYKYYVYTDFLSLVLESVAILQKIHLCIDFLFEDVTYLVQLRMEGKRASWGEILRSRDILILEW